MKTVESAHAFVKEYSYRNVRQQKQDSQSHLSASQKQLIYCDDYSFNQQPSETIKHRSKIYKPGSIQESQASIIGLNDLPHKYQSIYEELKDVQANELMHLFVQELDDHEKTRKRLVTAEIEVKVLQQEINQVKQLLNKKRDSIAQLCQTETKHLNMIQQMQGQLKNACFSAEGHFQKKYMQLQSYMNQYILSTNEAQQQLCKRLKLLKSQNKCLLKHIEELNCSIIQQNTKTQIVSSKFQRFNKMIALSKQKEATFTINIDNLEQECISLRKQNEMLRQRIRSNQSFEMELTKQNRQLSTELDFIRQKVHENQNLSKDIIEKIQEQNENASKITRDLQKVTQQKKRLEYQNTKIKMMLQESQRERQQQLRNRSAMASQFDQMSQEFNKLRFAMDNKIMLNFQMKQHIDKLKQQFDHLASEHEQLQSAYGQEREDKELLKNQLINLAEQVRFMQQSYQKEVSQNQTIKNYLQQYWQKRDYPLTQIPLNNREILRPQKKESFRKATYILNQSKDRHTLNDVNFVSQ